MSKKNKKSSSRKFAFKLTKKSSLALLALIIVIVLLGLVFRGQNKSPELNEPQTQQSQPSETKTSTPANDNTPKTKTVTTTPASSSTKKTTTYSGGGTSSGSSSGGAQQSQPTTPTPAPAPFSVTATATKIFEQIYVCTRERYIFAGQVTANKAGTANWEWIRWDGGTSGLSGTLTFDADGHTNDGITAYDTWIHPAYDVSGWMALKLTWNGGSYTSNHADFSYVYSLVDPPGQCP